MQIEVIETNAVAVVAIEGRIDAYTAPEAEDRLTSAVAGGNNLVIDLADTEYVSSAGLRVLITLAKRMRAGEFKMCLCGLQESVQEVFDIAGFSALFDIRESRQEAIEAVSAP